MLVVERMMAKKPRDRYQTPAEVALALEPFIRATAVAGAPRPRSGVRATDPSHTDVLETRPIRDRRRPRFAIATAILAFLVAGLLGVGVYRIVTDKGELVIETDSDDVEVVISKGGKVVKIIDTKSGKHVTLRSGDYELEVKDGLTISPVKMTIKRGKTVLASFTSLWGRETCRRTFPVGARKNPSICRGSVGGWVRSFPTAGKVSYPFSSRFTWLAVLIVRRAAASLKRYAFSRPTLIWRVRGFPGP
jgi:hypothetical protein